MELVKRVASLFVDDLDGIECVKRFMLGDDVRLCLDWEK